MAVTVKKFKTQKEILEWLKDPVGDVDEWYKKFPIESWVCLLNQNLRIIVMKRRRHKPL